MRAEENEPAKSQTHDDPEEYAVHEEMRGAIVPLLDLEILNPDHLQNHDEGKQVDLMYPRVQLPEGEKCFFCSLEFREEHGRTHRCERASSFQ